MLKTNKIFFIFIFFFSTTLCYCQRPEIADDTPPVEIGAVIPDDFLKPVGITTDFWNWTGPKDYHNSVVKVVTELGSGTGVVIFVDKSKPSSEGYLGYVATAYHMVHNNETGINVLSKIEYRNNRKAKICSTVQFDPENDVAIILAWVPKGIEAVSISKESISSDSKLEISGLGGDSLLSSLRSFRSLSSKPTNNDTIYANVCLLPGDSGGPIFSDSGDLVGIISGGWFWWDGSVKKNNGENIKITWPAKGCNTRPILNLMKKIRGI